jgi:hypothetical protein
VALWIVGVGVALSAASAMDTLARQPSFEAARTTTLALVRSLGLSDLCLFTEARYTRHLSQADLHSAFQDHPISIDHFPSGSLVSPPPAITRDYAHLVRKTALSD